MGWNGRPELGVQQIEQAVELIAEGHKNQCHGAKPTIDRDHGSLPSKRYGRSKSVTYRYRCRPCCPGCFVKTLQPVNVFPLGDVTTESRSTRRLKGTPHGRLQRYRSRPCVSVWKTP